MAALIKGCENVYGPTLLDVPAKEVILPKWKNLAVLEAESHELIMNKIAKDLGEREILQINEDNIRAIFDKFDRLKRNLRKSAGDKLKEKTIDSIFKGERTLNGAALIQCLAINRREQVEICKKYGTKIFNSLATIQETTMIEKQKNAYRVWLDKHQNSPMKSPIFKKMSFILNHVKKESHHKTVLDEKQKEKRKNKFKQLEEQERDRINKTEYQCKSVNRRKSMGYIPRPKIKNLL